MIARTSAAILLILAVGQFLSGQPSLQAQQPVLEVSPTSLSFEGRAGGPPPDPQYLTIANAGGEVMEWHASADAEWIILGATQGKLSGGREIQLLVWMKTEGLEAGEYQGTVRISSPNAWGSPVHVTVTLKLTAPPRLEVTPTSLSFQAEEGDPNPEPQTITIKNSGGGILGWEAKTDADWLRLGTYSGSLTAGQSTEVLVLVKATGLSAGTHRGRITITAPGAQGSPAVVEVSLELEARPRTLRVPQEFPTILSALEEARSGDIITIAPGIYEENLVITKSISLIGAGADKTVIKSLRAGYPVILIESEEEIKVHLEGLKITEAQRFSEDERCADDPICPDGLLVRGEAQVTLENCTVFDNEDEGLDIRESAQVTIANSRVSGNGSGIQVQDGAQVTLTNSQVFDNLFRGIEAQDRARVILIDSQVSGHQSRPPAEGWGLRVSDRAWASLTNSQIFNNYMGLWVTEDSQAIITDSAISSNEFGLLVSDSQVTLIESQVLNNGDNGIGVVGRSQVEIRNSVVRNNGNWGVAAKLRKCGVMKDDFTGKVELFNTQIYDNWRGDVCLPDLCLPEDSYCKPPLVCNCEPPLVCEEDCPFTDLQQAIDAAKPGDTIVIGPGRYGSIKITKSLTLLGNKWAEIYIEGCGLLCPEGVSIGVLVKNLDEEIEVRLRWLIISGHRGPVFYPFVPELGLQVGGKARVTLEKSVISHCLGDGFQVKDSASVTVTDSQIFANTDNGILVMDRASVTVRDSIIKDNIEWGIAAWLRKCGYSRDNFTGEVILENNEIYGNGKGDVCLP